MLCKLCIHSSRLRFIISEEQKMRLESTLYIQRMALKSKIPDLRDSY